MNNHSSVFFRWLWNSLLLGFFSVFLLQCGSKFVLTEEQKKDPEFLLYQGREFYIQRKYKRSLELFSIIFEQFPDRTYESSWAEYETGMIHYLKKDYEKARESFVRILQKYPVPSQPRVLSLVLIRKIDQGQAYKRSNYE